MPRLRQVPKSEATAPIVTTMYEWLFEGRDPVAEPGTFTGCAGRLVDRLRVGTRCPRSCRQGIRPLPEPQTHPRPHARELGQIRAGWAAGSQFVFSQHAKSMRDMGLPEEKITSIPAWTVADCYDATERAVLAYTDCLVYAHGRVPDDLLAECVAACRTRRSSSSPTSRRSTPARRHVSRPADRVRRSRQSHRRGPRSPGASAMHSGTTDATDDTKPKTAP